MRIQDLYAHNWMILTTGGRFLNTGKGCASETKLNDSEHCKKKKPGYFVIVNGSKVCAIGDALGSQNYVFSSDDENVKLFEVIMMEALWLPNKCGFF